MSWNGNGTFTRTLGSAAWQGDAAAGTKIVANRHDTNDTDMATGINACVAKNGENAFTGTTGASAFRGAVDNTSDLGSTSLRWRNLYAGTSVIFQGASFATTVTAAPTANRSIVLPNSSGTVSLTSDANSVALATANTTSGATVTLVASGMSATAYRTIFINFEAVSLSGTNDILIQLADQTSGFLTAGYNARAVMLTSGANSVTTSSVGFNITTLGAAETVSGSVRLSCSPTSSLPGADKWFCEGNVYPTGSSAVETITGWVQLTVNTPAGLLDGIRIVSSGGVQTFDAGRVTVIGYT